MSLMKYHEQKCKNDNKQRNINVQIAKKMRLLDMYTVFLKKMTPT